MKLFTLTAALCLLTACGRIGNGNDSGVAETSIPKSGGGTVGTGGETIYKPTPLLWEGHNQDGLLWSSFVYQIIGSSVAPQLLPGSNDITDFCPSYSKASDPERVNFWGFLISAVAKYESGFNPTSRFNESTMGTDPITHLPVYSEGLLQLSYQDIQAYPFCEFNWAVDRLLGASDPKKTILDPFKNLECGIKILAQQIHRKGSIALSSGVYWSTLKLGGRYSKLAEIEAMTAKLPFCDR